MNNPINDNTEQNKDENIEEKLLSQTKFTLPYLSLLMEYSNNNPVFLQKNPELFQKVIETIIKSPKMHKNMTQINTAKSQILNFFSQAIEHKDIYNNDWLTYNINEFFKLRLPKGNLFYRALDNLAKNINNLDFTSNPMSEEVKNIADGNSPIKLHEPITFCCQIDTNKLSYQTKINKQSLYFNLRISFDFLKELLDKEPTLSFRSNFTETNEQVFSIIVLHHSEDLQDKLPKFINYICYDIDHSIELTREKMDSVYLRFEMESEMSKNTSLKKTSMKI